MRTVNHYFKIKIVNGMTAEKREEINGVVECRDERGFWPIEEERFVQYN